jgi:hypothetical protein
VQIFVRDAHFPQILLSVDVVGSRTQNSQEFVSAFEVGALFAERRHDLNEHCPGVRLQKGVDAVHRIGRIEIQRFQVIGY